MAVLCVHMGRVLIAVQLVLLPALHITFLLTSEPCLRFPPNPERPPWCWLWVAALPVELTRGRLKDAPLQGVRWIVAGVRWIEAQRKAYMEITETTCSTCGL